MFGRHEETKSLARVSDGLERRWRVGVGFARFGHAGPTCRTPTSADQAVLESTFVKYQLARNEMNKTDHIKWTRSATGPVEPLTAYDAVDHRYWALAHYPAGQGLSRGPFV
jgi:hypothetical protein